MSSRFDELAKALAAGVSRREALRLFGGGLMIGLLAPLGVGKGWGAPPPPGCGRLCHDAGVPSGGSAWTDCVHRCGVCEANALQACVSFVSATLTVTCCGPTGTCGTGALAGVCVCPGGTVDCLGTTAGVPTQSCCTGAQVCNTTAGICV